MHSLTDVILTANVSCYLLLGLAHLWPHLVPERFHRPMTGLLYLAIGLTIAAKGAAVSYGADPGHGQHHLEQPRPNADHLAYRPTASGQQRYPRLEKQSQNPCVAIQPVLGDLPVGIEADQGKAPQFVAD